MNSVPSGDSGDAVQRLLDEQWHILELFETYARQRRDGATRVAEAGRLATLIYTLLRVHCELETMLLRAALRDEVDFRSAASEVARRRGAMLDALQHTETLSPRDPAHAQEMDALASRVRTWFQNTERQVFPLARRSRLDLGARDQDMAARQEFLLCAERAVPRVYASRSLGSALG